MIMLSVNMKKICDFIEHKGFKQRSEEKPTELKFPTKMFTLNFCPSHERNKKNYVELEGKTLQRKF